MKLSAIEAVIRNGQRDDAIELYLEATGASMEEAETAVAHFIANDTWPFSAEDSAQRIAEPSAIGPLEREELAYLLQVGKKASAIKRFRELTALGLKESQHYIQELERSVAGRERTSTPVRPPRVLYVIIGIIILTISMLLILWH